VVEHPSASLRRLTRALADTEPRAPLAVRLCTALVRILAVDGGAITIGYAESERTTLAATDDLAERMEDLQDLLREGPALDAFRTGEVVVLTRAEQRLTWPLLVQALGDDHVPELVLGVPMSPQSDVLGAVTLHSSAPEPPDLDLAEVSFLANAVGVAILGTFDRQDSTDLVWRARDQVNQATGMVVAQLRINPQDAVAVLRAHAFAHGVSLTTVAEAVLSRDLDFRTDDDHEG
jgi:hypothetical protein